MKPFDTLHTQCRHIEHLHEEVYTIKIFLTKIIAYLLNLVWAHKLEIFAVNCIPTSGSQQVWPLVFFVKQHIPKKNWEVF